MKHLVVFAHPNPKSFNAGLLEAIVETSKSLGNEVVVRDLYKENFNPVLGASDFENFHKGEMPGDIKKEQEFINWADHITFVHPVWWAGFPAMLKGYIDRVFTINFAYAYTPEGPKGLLGGKSASVVSTSGTPFEVYDENGMYHSLMQTCDEGILKFCGIDVTFHRLWGNVVLTDDDARKKMLDETRKIVEAHCRF